MHGNLRWQQLHRPCPRLRMRKQPIEAQDVREDESCEGNAVEEESEMLQESDGEHAIGPKIGINMVPRVTKSGFEVQDGERLMLQSGKNRGEIETHVGLVGEQRRRNPRRGKQSDTVNT